MNRPPLRVQILADIEEFVPLRDAWDALLQVSVERCPTLSHAWLLAWWRAFAGPEDRFVALLLWRGSELACGLPLRHGTSRDAGPWAGRVFTTLSNTWVDRGGILIRPGDDAALEALVDALVSGAVEWDSLVLQQRAGESPVTPVLRELFRRRGLLVGVDEGLHSPFLPLPASWDDVMAGLSSSFRQTLRRKLRAAGKMPGLEMQIRRDAEVFGPILAISEDSWQHDAGTSMASAPHLREFFRSVIVAAADSGTLYSSVLSRDGNPVAFEFNLRLGGTLHNFKLGYRKAEAEWSPGLVLKEFTIRRFVEEFGPSKLATEYDFMGTSEGYKLNWTRSVRRHEHLTVARRSAGRNAAFAWRYGIKPFIRARFPRLMALRQRLRGGAS